MHDCPSQNMWHSDDMFVLSKKAVVIDSGLGTGVAK